MSIKKLALFGGVPEFSKPIPVGQLYFPSWEDYESAMRGIFERQYYTNHGPLVSELERKISEFLNVKEAILVTNNTVGLMMVAEALGLSGHVIMPALTFIASGLSLVRCGLKPIFCDIAEGSIFPSINELEAANQENVSAVLGVHLWGSAANILEIENWSKQKGYRVIWDSAQAFGCKIEGGYLGIYGEAEVFSFHATKVLSCTEGGCITTNNPNLAERLRNIRSSYGTRSVMSVSRTTNARMSEMQAAIGILSLNSYQENVSYNLKIRNLYKQLIGTIPGIELLKTTGVTDSNFQSIVVIVDPNIFGVSRDRTVSALKAEGVNARRYFLPSLHTLTQFTQGRDYCLPNTDAFQASNIVLPIGAATSVETVERICNLLLSINKHRSDLNG